MKRHLLVALLAVGACRGRAVIDGTGGVGGATGPRAGPIATGAGGRAARGADGGTGAAASPDAGVSSAETSEGADSTERRLSVGERQTARAYDRAHCRAKRRRGKHQDAAPCCVSGVWALGTDRRGQSLTVVEVDTAPGAAGANENACVVPDAKAGGTAASDEEAGDDEAGGCHGYEYWLLTERRGKIVRRDSIVDRCDGDKEESSIDVDVPQRLLTSSAHSLFDNNQWQHEEVIGLDPLRTVEKTEDHYNTTTAHKEVWNGDRFAGEVVRAYDYCAGRAPPDAGAMDDRDYPPVESTAIAIPRIEVPRAMANDGWRSVGLGRCAALVDGDRHGYTIHGTKGTPTDASMRVLVSTNDDLFVDVEDDRLTSGGASWVKDDHVELWVQQAADDCVDPSARRGAGDSGLKQWGIRVSDGRVFSGFASPPPEAIRAEVARAGTTTHVRIHLPWAFDTGMLTVVYSDSDDGVHQKRLIATSAFEYGRAWTLGEAFDVPGEGPVCEVRRGHLEPLLAARHPSAAAEP